MKVGNYKNISLTKSRTIQSSKLDELIQKEVLFESETNDICSHQEIQVDLNSHTLDIDGARFPIACSKDDVIMGIYHVVEKWYNPYWRKNGLIYVPGDYNPIGKFLVILADLSKETKVPYSIHTWPLYPFSNSEFKQGNYSNGCVRTRKEDASHLFQQIQLGAKISFLRS